MANIGNALKSPFLKLGGLWRRGAPKPSAEEKMEAIEAQTVAPEPPQAAMPSASAAAPEPELDWKQRVGAWLRFPALRKRSEPRAAKKAESEGEKTLEVRIMQTERMPDSEKLDSEPEGSVPQPGWKARLGGLLARLPLRKRKVSAENGGKAEAPLAGNDKQRGQVPEAEQGDAEQDAAVAKPGWKTRLGGWLARLSLRKRKASAENGGEAEAPLAGNDKHRERLLDAEEAAADPSWKTRFGKLLAKVPLRRRSKTAAADEESDEDDYSKSPVAKKSKVAFKGSKARGSEKQGRSREIDDAEANAEEVVAQPSFIARLGNGFTGTLAKISYVIVIVVAVYLLIQEGVWQILDRQKQAINELQAQAMELRREKILLEQKNKKILARQQELVADAAGGMANSDAGAGAAGNAGEVGGGGTAVGADCSVSNGGKNVGDALKRCIQQYNAMTGR